MKKSVPLILAGVAVIGLAACGDPANSRQALLKNAAYWQRANTSEAAYMDGPKAQQMLQRDIARCTTELRELEMLGALRNTMPAEQDSRYHKPAGSGDMMAQIEKWDTPSRDAYLMNEHGHYHDFETCMIEKGWGRVEHLPYNIADRSRKDYLRAITNEQYRTRMGEREAVFTTRQTLSDPSGRLND